MNCKKRILALLLPAFLAASCAAPVTEQPEDTSLLQITDDAGRQVEVSTPVESAGVLIGSFADEWRLAGGEESLKAAAHDAFTSFGLPENAGIADTGEIKSPNTELLLEQDPDLVIGSAKNQSHQALADQMEEMGIPMLLFDVSTFEDYLRTLKTMTEITGDEEAYETWGLSQQQAIEDIKDAVPQEHPRVLYLRAAGSKVKAMNSQDNVLGAMLEDLQAENIAETGSSLNENLSMEAIVEADPDIILLVLQGSDDSRARKALEEQITSSPAWNSLRAVQNGQVYTMDQKLFNLKPNARWAEAYQILYDTLYEN